MMKLVFIVLSVKTIRNKQEGTEQTVTTLEKLNKDIESNTEKVENNKRIIARELIDI